MNKSLKLSLILIVTGLGSIATGHSQSPPASQALDAKQMPGHEKKEKDALKESTGVAVAVFTSLGNRGPGSSGEDEYDQARIEVVTALGGNLPDKMEVFYSVYSMPGKDLERAPVLGTQYIVFIHQLGPKEYQVNKILLATDDNLAKVKALIAERGIR